MQMNNEIAHFGNIDRLARLGLPGLMRLGIVRVDTDNIQFGNVFELDIIEFGQLATKYQMQELLWFVVVIVICHGRFLVDPPVADFSALHTQMELLLAFETAGKADDFIVQFSAACHKPHLSGYRFVVAQLTATQI